MLGEKRGESLFFQAEKAAEAFRKLPVETFVCTPVF